MTARSGRDLADATRAAARAARDAVHRVPWTAGSELALPSCTFVSAACRGDEAVIGWIGDSRAYWLAERDARRLTVDDSWATEQVADGLLSAAAAAADQRAPCPHPLGRRGRARRRAAGVHLPPQRARAADPVLGRALELRARGA